MAGSEPEATRLSFPVNLSPWRPEGRRPEVERLGESARGGGAPVQRGLRGRLSPPRQRPCARLKPVPLLEALHLLEHFLTGGGGGLVTRLYIHVKGNCHNEGTNV